MRKKHFFQNIEQFTQGFNEGFKMKFVSFLHWSFLFIFLFAKWATKETSPRGLAGQRAVSTVVPEDWDIVSANVHVLQNKMLL